MPRKRVSNLAVILNEDKRGQHVGGMKFVLVIAPTASMDTPESPRDSTPVTVSLPTLTMSKQVLACLSADN
jgi:hypothetical protein